MIDAQYFSFEQEEYCPEVKLLKNSLTFFFEERRKNMGKYVEIIEKYIDVLLKTETAEMAVQYAKEKKFSMNRVNKYKAKGIQLLAQAAEKEFTCLNADGFLAGLGQMSQEGREVFCEQPEGDIQEQDYVFWYEYPYWKMPPHIIKWPAARDLIDCLIQQYWTQIAERMWEFVDTVLPDYEQFLFRSVID